jgi:type II secretory pathway component PulF
MGNFHYKAVTSSGEHISGRIEAIDRRNAVSLLLEKGQFVIEMADGSAAGSVQLRHKDGGQAVSDIRSLSASILRFGVGRVSSKDILAFTSQLSTALRAGLPLLNALEIILQQQHKAGFRQMLEKIADNVRSGQSLSDSLAMYPNVFSPLYISMIKVGETGGFLEKTATQLTSLLSRDDKIKTSLKNASAYPIFVMGLGLVSVIIVITWILPKILSTITISVAMLPLPTRILLAMSDFFKASVTTIQGLFFVVLIIAGFVYLKRWIKTKGRLQWDSFKLKIPIFGSVLCSIAVGRFARTLGSLTQGGVTILEALSVVRDTLGNELLGREIDKVAEKVRGGATLAEPLAQSGYFPPLLVQITSVGEQTGKLDELLLNAAETFDEQADAAINRFVAVYPAVLILLLALIVGFIIASTLLPLVMMELGAANL